MVRSKLGETIKWKGERHMGFLTQQNRKLEELPWRVVGWLEIII